MSSWSGQSAGSRPCDRAQESAGGIIARAGGQWRGRGRLGGPRRGPRAGGRMSAAGFRGTLRRRPGRNGLLRDSLFAGFMDQVDRRRRNVEHVEFLRPATRPPRGRTRAPGHERLAQRRPGLLELARAQVATVGTVLSSSRRPVSRSMLRTRWRSRGSTSVTAAPSRPARPVRPIRCTYDLGRGRHVVVDDVGHVADVQPPRRDVRREQELRVPSRKRFITRSRSFWKSPPWIASAR